MIVFPGVSDSKRELKRKEFPSAAKLYKTISCYLCSIFSKGRGQGKEQSFLFEKKIRNHSALGFWDLAHDFQVRTDGITWHSGFVFSASQDIFDWGVIVRDTLKNDMFDV